MQVLNERTSDVILSDIKIANSWWSRLRGLLGTGRLDENSGILLTPCRSVHTWGMCYGIDVVFIDQDDRVVSMKEWLMPWSHALGGTNAYSTLEIPGGTIQKVGIQIGDVLKCSGNSL